jgi:hypothetical protein
MVSTSRRINAQPTKDLFINMLVRDIPLIRAIIDLVDNSVDGATQLQGDSYQGLWIKITANKHSFKIEDNCGGMSVADAEEYAFKFGRANDAEATPKSIGRFGIGMKRAFFKIGRKFTVESTTSNSRFSMSVDVEEWKKRDDWVFEFQDVQENLTTSSSEIGTCIVISELHENVAGDLGLDVFLSELKEELTVAYSLKIRKQLRIYLNDIEISPVSLDFRVSETIKVARFEEEYTYFGSQKISTPVKVKLYAGLSDRDFDKGGWYIFCNERMVLEADQTEITGWGSKSSLPKYHADFAFFRGYIFFESDDASYLPWTTTKTGIDSDSPIYKAVKNEISKMTVPVIKFLRKMADEKHRVTLNEIDTSLLEDAYNSTHTCSIFDIEENTSPSFEMPEQSEIPPRERLGTIKYSKPLSDIEVLKDLLGVASNKEVGEKSFDYYLDSEG